MNFNEMTDFKLNLLAAKILFCGQGVEFLPQQKQRGLCGFFGFMSSSCYMVDSNGIGATFNFCKPEDMMEMVERDDIVVMPFRDNHWKAAIIDASSPTLEGQLVCESGPQGLASKAVVITFLLNNEEYLKRILKRESEKPRWPFEKK